MKLMNSRTLCSLFLLTASLGTVATESHAGPRHRPANPRGVFDPKQPTVTPDPEPVSPLWEVTVRPYGWLASLEGTTGIKGVTVETDVPFRTILKNLEMVGALQLDLRRDRWMLLLDGMYLRMSAGGETPGRLLSNIDVQVEQVLAEAAVGYRVWESDRGYFDVFAGIRYMHLGSEISLDLDSQGVHSLSDDLSREAVARVSSAVRAAINNATPQLSGRAKDKLTSAASARIQQRVDQALDNHPNFGKALVVLSRTDGRISNAIRELVAARIAEKQETLADATAAVSSEVAAAKARGREKLRRAVARAEKNIAKEIESALTDAIPDRVSGAKDWVDPFVGFRGRYNFTDRLYAVARADVGGFGVGSNLAWQLYAGLGCQLSPRTSLELGYRSLDMEYTSGGFTYDTTTSGIFTALGIRF